MMMMNWQYRHLTLRTRPLLIPLLFFQLKECSSLFVSSAPPRFDQFSERLLGNWVVVQSHDDDGSADSTVAVATAAAASTASTAAVNAPTTTLFKVDEVMRSCGGAVQGIKDWNSQQQQHDNMIYLNRANDGFIFTDQGDYSLGPVVMTFEELNNDLFLFQSSFIFGKSRVIVGTQQPQHGNEEDAALLPTAVPCKKSSSSTYQDDELTSLVCSRDGPPANVSMQPNSVARCSMPSPSQPWMMQRVKWEKCIRSETASADTSSTTTSNDITKNAFSTWTCIYDDPQLFAEWSGVTFQQQGRVFCAGAIFNGAFKSVARQYSTITGQLSAIMMLEGHAL